MICFPNAKINLGLHVIGQRSDGYHDIETVFYPVSCTDILEIIEPKNQQGGERKLQMICEGLEVQGNANDNLVVKAYQLLVKDYPVIPPLQCVLYKKIPMGAGLGGGSSDAAFMIRLLNDTYTLGLNNDQMKYYAAQLGSDCAFFIDNKPSYAFGRGYELEEISLDLSAYHIELLYPGVHSDTATAYRNVPKRGHAEGDASLKKLIRQPVQNWRNTIGNDFERSVFAAVPQLAAIKEQLYENGALYASMSGSGSAVFGIFSKKTELPEGLKKMVCYSGAM